MSSLAFRNSTDLQDDRLQTLFCEGLNGWAVGTIDVHVRHSRSADFSGTCFYATRRVYINLGRHLHYPYLMKTHLAKAKTMGRRWYKPLYTVELADGYELALFIFMHELYHLLVKKARRNTRQKESMCDRFAARHLVGRFGRPVRDPQGRRVPRDAWDFQDLNGFVAESRDGRARSRTSATAAESEAALTPAGEPLLFAL